MVKLLVDKSGERVLFAEAGKDFVDLLFHIMTLPIGTVIKLLDNNGMVGCVGNLYSSIQNISNEYMESSANKAALLTPKSPSCGARFPLLLTDSSASESKTYYECSSGYSCSNVVDCSNVSCPKCHQVMAQRVVFLNTEPTKSGTSLSSGYVKEVVTYMVMDNLEVKPMSTISSFTLFNVKDIGALEEKEVAVGMNEALGILKASLYSKNVITNVFFGKK